MIDYTYMTYEKPRRLGRVPIKPGILHQADVRNYKFDGALL